MISQIVAFKVEDAKMLLKDILKVLQEHIWSFQQQVASTIVLLALEYVRHRPAAVRRSRSAAGNLTIPLRVSMTTEKTI